MLKKIISLIGWFAIPVTVILVSGCRIYGTQPVRERAVSGATVEKVKNELIEKYGERNRNRIEKGVYQLAKNWFMADGSEDEFAKFCVRNYLPDSLLHSNFLRIEHNLAIQNGYLSKIRFSFTESERFTDGIQERVDEFFRKSIPEGDAYKEKLAQFIQLNYPAYTLDEKRRDGYSWDRVKWAMVRLGDMFAERRDPGFKPESADEVREFQNYIGNYFFRMDHIFAPEGQFPFAKPLTLHSHFGLRDNLKEDYTRPGGLARQKITGRIIEHIAQGTVPVEFILDTTTRWDPWNNKLFRMDQDNLVVTEPETEGTRRYAGLLAEFRNKSSFDQTYPEGSTVISRTFGNANFKPDEVENLIRRFLSDTVIISVGRVVSQRLARPLEPFDIWYSGFQEQSIYPADFLDSLTRSRYPNPGALQKDLPSILFRMGFPEQEANYIGTHAKVRPVRGGGYSDQPPMRGDTALMTTVFNPGGLDYKAYRISMHELGHVVCGVYSTSEADHDLLADVPTGGITEGMAEMLAYKNLEGLGLGRGVYADQRDLLAMASVWYLLDMGGQSLTDIETWKWMYAHPGATPEELKTAVLEISAGIWNRYFSPIFGGSRDQHILSIYNHFITGSLYLFNYFLGNVIMFQLYDAFSPDGLADGLKRSCREGNTLPELWMEHAVGKPITVEPLLNAAREAVIRFNKHNSGAAQ